MKSVAPHDRPREKLERVGAGGLGDNELLAIVLGQGVPRASALDLANAVLASAAAFTVSPDRHSTTLRQVPGIGARAGRADDRRRRSGPPHADSRPPRAAADHERA